MAISSRTGSASSPAQRGLSLLLRPITRAHAQVSLPTRPLLTSACDPSCLTCAGESTFCTTCTTGLAFNGTCLPDCPPTTIQSNGTCVQCHPDCATCSSSSSADKCLTCPSSRPILSRGRCLPFCPQGQFFHAPNATCTPCAANCRSCLNAESCTSCREGFTLASGVCTPASCDGPFAQGLGICLSALVQSAEMAAAITAPPAKSRSLLWLLGLFAALALLAAAGVLWVRRERARTRAATAAFAQRLDEVSVRKRLARLFGYTSVAEEGARLRDLVLRPKAQPARPRSTPSTSTPGDIRKSLSGKGSFESERWITPPPPYAPPESMGDGDGFDAIPLTPLNSTSLPPPPRPIFAPEGERERIPDPNHTVRMGEYPDAVPLSPGAMRELRELWPHLGRRYHTEI